MDKALLEQQKELNDYLCKAKHMVFFGGAGVSTESGIPDFRSADGLYNQQYKYPPEEVISHSFFLRNPAEFYRFYKDRMIFPDVKPNAAHRRLAQLEQDGNLAAIVTQNIDGLHQAAGSKTVLELHGSIHRNYCMDCHKFYSLDELMAQEGIPHCTSCSGIIKPDVVLYEEPLVESVIRAAIKAIASADLLLIAGTSLAVYPAASFIDYFQGDKLIIINKSPTPRDQYADLVISGSIGELLAMP